MLEQTQGLHLHTKFHLNVFIVSASGGQKPQFLANFDILGAPVPTPFYRNLVCYSRPTVYACVPNLVSIGLFCRRLAAKNLNFCHILDSAFSGVANRQQSEKVEHRCTTSTNLPLSNGIKIVSVFQRLHGESGRTISDVQTRDGQTDKQTKNNIFGRPGGG